MDDRSRLPSIGPLIWYRDPHAAIAWLEKAFGFELRLVVDGADGAVIHSELTFGDGYIMAVGPPREKAVSPIAWGGRSTQSVHVQLQNGIDAHCERARAAGARIAAEPETQFYGARTYRALDLEGHVWNFNQTVREVSGEEMEAASGLTIRTSLEGV